MSQAASQAKDRMDVRTSYRKIIQKFEDERPTLVLPDSQLLDKGLNIGVLDAELLHIISDLTVEQAQRVKIQDWDPAGFIMKLRQRVPLNQAVEEEDETSTARTIGIDFQALGALAAKFINTTPSPDFMLGAMKVNPPRRNQKERQKRQREEIAEVVKPTEGPPVEEHASNVTTKGVDAMNKKLAAVQGETDLLSFICDPHSFSNSVLNLFHVSFLIKQGYASTKRDENGRFLISYETPPDAADFTSGKVDNAKQFVFRLDYDTWAREAKALDPDADVTLELPEDDDDDGEAPEEDDPADEISSEEEDEEDDGEPLINRRKRLRK